MVKDTILRRVALLKEVSAEAEHHFIDCSMDNGKIIMVVEAGTRVARPEFLMMKFVSEAEEDPLQLIQMQHSITNSKGSEHVKSNS